MPQRERHGTQTKEKPEDQKGRRVAVLPAVALGVRGSDAAWSCLTP